MGSSETLVVALRVVDVGLCVMEVVGLMAVDTVADDWMFNAFALQLILLMNSHEFFHQFLDEGLRKKQEPEQVSQK